MSDPAGAGPLAPTCRTGRGVRRAARWVPTQPGVPGRPGSLLRRAADPPAAAGREPAGGVRVHLLGPSGALVPVVLHGEPGPDRWRAAADPDPGRR